MGRAVLDVADVTGPRPDPRVHDVTMHIHHGEVWHVHGDSGAGKTSLLRLLARLDPLAAGRMRLAGHITQDVPVTEWRRRVSLVFQEPRLFAGTIAQNVTWGATVHSRRVDVPHLLKRAGIKLAPEREAGGLSGGEAKRVAIARALAVDPDVILLDEPTAPLDERNRGAIRNLIRALAADGRGVVLVSHLRDDLLAVPGPALHLVDGQVRGILNSTDLHAHLEATEPVVTQ